MAYNQNIKTNEGLILASQEQATGTKARTEISSDANYIKKQEKQQTIYLVHARRFHKLIINDNITQ